MFQNFYPSGYEAIELSESDLCLFLMKGRRLIGVLVLQKPLSPEAKLVQCLSSCATFAETCAEAVLQRNMPRNGAMRAHCIFGLSCAISANHCLFDSTRVM